MANRSTLHVDRLEAFKQWLVDDGWDLEDPKGDYEVLRARKPGRNRPLILWRRLSNSGGGDLTHLTYDDRDGWVIRAFLNDRKESVENYTVEDMLMFVLRTGAEVSIKPYESTREAGPCFTVRLTKCVRPTRGNPVPWTMETVVDPQFKLGMAGTMKFVLETLEQNLDLAVNERYHEEAERRKPTQ